MKRNIILLVALLALSAVAWYLVREARKGSTLSDYEGSFAVPDTTMIGRIKVLDRQGRSLDLARKESYWELNGKYRAEPRIMKEMLETVSQIEVKFIPSPSMVPNILKSLGTHGRRVDVYSTSGKVLKTYYIGGVTQDGTGTFCMMEGSEQPFVVTMKYFHGSVSSRFFLDEKDWRDRTLLPLREEDILRFSVEYPRDREKSFVISRDGGDLKVDPFHDLTARSKGKLDRDLVKTYLKDVASLRIEGFNNENPDRDSLSRQLPFCTVRVDMLDSSSMAVAFHPMLTMDRRGNVLTGRDGKPLPIERYHVSSSWGDFMVVQNEPFKPLFATYSLFFRD